MSTAAREVTWAGGTHVFDLNSERVSWMLNSEFPGQHGDSIAAALKRFEEQVYSPADIENVFRVGLLGGGMADGDVHTLIATHVRGQPLEANAVIAFNLVVAVFVGDTDASTSA